MQKLFFYFFGSKANLLQGRVVRMAGIPSSFTEPGAKKHYFKWFSFSVQMSPLLLRGVPHHSVRIMWPVHVNPNPEDFNDYDKPTTLLRYYYYATTLLRNITFKTQCIQLENT